MERGGVIGSLQPQSWLVTEYGTWQRTRKVSCLCFVKCAMTKCWGAPTMTPPNIHIYKDTHAGDIAWSLLVWPTNHICINIDTHTDTQTERLQGLEGGMLCACIMCVCMFDEWPNNAHKMSFIIQIYTHTHTDEEYADTHTDIPGKYIWTCSHTNTQQDSVFTATSPAKYSWSSTTIVSVHLPRAGPYFPFAGVLVSCLLDCCVWVSQLMTWFRPTPPVFHKFYTCSKTCKNICSHKLKWIWCSNKTSVS